MTVPVPLTPPQNLPAAPSISPHLLELWLMLKNETPVPVTTLEGARKSAIHYLNQAAPWFQSASAADLAQELYAVEFHLKASVGGAGLAEVDDESQKRFWADYLHDLRHVPLWAIKAACRSLRTDGVTEFLPAPGVFLARANEAMRPLRRDVAIAKAVRDHKPPEVSGESITDDDWARMRAILSGPVTDDPDAIEGVP